MRARTAEKVRLYTRRVVAVTILSAVTFIFLRGAWHMYERYQAADTAREAASTQVQELRDREASLTLRIERLSSDRGMEEELRRRFGVVREGEEVIEVVEAPPQPTLEAEKGGFFGWLRRVF